ncbi:hypothetical protein A4H97_32195 [Niastella yeongjuensis]|uniref:Uncharacterized protein n=1 Tax=Niastella yeongjuensis TaxID=354355 RepID=A0A1V9EIX7_9BACT|nr:hypothetical protein [Niastella yeongjuensis]OQP45904.1 hypothetical protein A4H97_32195 [Niastella yeongjuensis]SEP46853.1 hypothetical protein SAMN05660816_06521 [Niastella yeongjuensis]
MKRILVFAFAFICIRASGQQVPSQVQAKRGVFDRLYLKDNWITRISTSLNTGDTSDNLLPTGSAIGPLIAGAFLQNQSSVAQPANFWIAGSAVVGSHNSYKNTGASGWPALFNVTHGGGQYGLSIQRSSADQGPADIVLYKNNQLAAFGSDLRPLSLGDPVGQISFSGIAGDNSTVRSPMSITGRIEKAAPSYMSSGFVFSTTDNNGVARQTYLNAQGNLLIGGNPDNIANNYRLNVASGDVRVNGLSENGDVLVMADSNGVLKKIYMGYGLAIYDGYLYVNGAEEDDPDYNLQQYTASLRIYNQEVTAYAFKGQMDIIWTRDSVGHYTGTVPDGDPFITPFTWLHSSTGPSSVNVGATRLYAPDAHTLKLVVKDGNFNDTDDWKDITIDIRIYISG